MVPSIIVGLSGIVITFTVVAICSFYWNKLRRRKFIGDTLFVNFVFAFSLMYFRKLIRHVFPKLKRRVQSV